MAYLDFFKSIEYFEFNANKDLFIEQIHQVVILQIALQPPNLT